MVGSQVTETNQATTADGCSNILDVPMECTQATVSCQADVTTVNRGTQYAAAKEISIGTQTRELTNAQILEQNRKLRAPVRDLQQKNKELRHLKNKQSSIVTTFSLTKKYLLSKRFLGQQTRFTRGHESFFYRYGQ